MISYHLTSLVLVLFIFLNPSAQTLTEVSDDLQERYASCLKLMGDEQYGLAISGFQKLLADHPEFHILYRNIVEAYIFCEKIDSAAYYFQALQQRDKQNPYVYYALARVAFHLGENQNAIEKLKECISLDPTFPDAYGPFGGLPEVFKASGELEAGERYFGELIAKSPKNPYSYYGLGRIYAKRGDLDRALHFYMKSIEVDSLLTYGYHACLFVYSTKGEYKNALNSGQKLLKLALRENDLEMAAYALLRIGGFYFLGGNFEKSLVYLTRSLQLASNIGAKRREGMALTNVGVLYATLGNKTKALEYFTQSLGLLHKTEAFRTEIRTLYNIGLLQKDLKNYPEAFRVLNGALLLVNERGYKIEKCMILTGLAETYTQVQDLSNALDKYQAALMIAEEVDEKAEQGYILTKLGDLYFRLKDYEKSNDYHLKSLAIGKEIHHAQIIWEANTGLGAVYQASGEAQKAIDYYAAAISVYDSVRKNLNIESLATGFLEDRYEVYPSIIQLLAQEQKYEKSFDFVEKYKAKTLLNILAKGQFLISELLPDSIRFSLIEIKDQLENAHFELSRELTKTDQGKERLLELDQKITALELQKVSIIKSVRENFNPYFQMTSAEPISLSELQNSIIRDGQLLIEFVVGSNSTSLFAISRDTLIYHSIPIKRDELKQKLVRLSNIFQAQTSEDRKSVDYIFSPEQADFSVPPAYTLYADLLKNLEPIIGQSQELIIVPDDFLYYLPFEALVTDTNNTQNRYDFQNAKFLIEKVNISYLQSASLLDPTLNKVKNPARSLLAFGNPDFELPETSQMDVPERNNSRIDRLLPLPNSEAEVKNIGNLLSGSPQVFVGKNASERNFKQRASEFRIIHLASHFEINDTDPLYSKVILSQKENSQEDGYLQTYEVFDLRLNADLVVLSSCNTALGKLRKGEGLIGISRAFLYAGVPSMVVSLWNVEDKATGIIMENFYGYLKQGVNKNKALRLAKLDYLKDAEVSRKDPFFWAPFVLFGDLNPIQLEAKTNYLNLTLYSVLLLTLVAGLVLLIKNQLSKTKASPE